MAKRDDTQAGLRPECRLGPREQFNEISSLIDGGVVYSNEPELLHQLRHGRGGGGDGGDGGGDGGGGGGDGDGGAGGGRGGDGDGGGEDNDDDHDFRSHKGGLMKTLPMFENKNLRDLLPLKVRPSKKTKLIDLPNRYKISRKTVVL